VVPLERTGAFMLAYAVVVVLVAVLIALLA
jgi:hypothetical protein